MSKLPSSPGFDLSGKRALVAGASSGIGVACAVALAEQGAHVTLSARRLDRLEDISNQMKERDFKVDILQLDISDIQATSEQISKNGPYDILVNSAGLARHSKTTDTTLEDYDAVMNINVRGAYFLTQAVAKGLLEAKKAGSLINISSQMAHVGGQERAVYCASKHAVEGFTKAMAIEFAPNQIRVNTICPTFIKTELTEQTFKDPAKKAWVEEKIKLGRIGEVEDIMGAVQYLASNASSLVTGTSLLVDGGWTAD